MPDKAVAHVREEFRERGGEWARGHDQLRRELDRRVPGGNESTLRGAVEEHLDVVEEGVAALDHRRGACPAVLGGQNRGEDAAIAVSAFALLLRRQMLKSHLHPEISV